MYRNELQSHHAQDCEQELVDFEENPFYVTNQPTNDAFVALGLSYITVSEFESVPKYVN